MFLLGFSLGLGLGIGFWMWQQVQLEHYLKRIFKPLNSHYTEVALPLMPRLREQIAVLMQKRQNLQESLETYQELLNVAPLGYLQVDEENQLLWCNKLAKEMLYLERWQPGQVRLLLELVRSYELDRLIEQTRDCQQPRVKEWVFHPSFENAAAMLEVKSLALRASSFPLPKGQVGVFLENRQPLLDMNQARERSFSDLAHELRTPLTSIRLVVETLQNRLEPPLNRWVNRLMQEVDRLINLVQGWLDLTQMETDPTIQLNPETVEVRSLIASVWETLEPLAQQQNLNLSYSGIESVFIKADRSRIYQVFLNLLDNCIKYSLADTTIQVQTKIVSTEATEISNSTSSSLEIDIIDAGVGFSSADLPHVFERFYRGDKARARNQIADSHSTPTIVGSGLGLAIVKQIILAHGGWIKAMNHPETGGAWIQLQLPEVMANNSSQDYS
ncbi:PAS/PAC sensor signal transduction histidine kinase [Calothrix brevissima NIES-22]|nr:PAS/PAC sensor signal transduction histidine kinase [Calothrix brevissima NIES-22]